MVPTGSTGTGLTGRNQGPEGFTLLELLVALTVVSVAMAVFIGMFNAGLGLQRSNANLTVATELAESHLAAITAAPCDYLWNSDGKSARFSVTTRDPEPAGGYPVRPPEMTLVTREAQQRLSARYGGFHWSAFAELAAPDAPAYALSVVIRWDEGGRPQALTLTSAVARSRVDGGAPTAGGGHP